MQAILIAEVLCWLNLGGLKVLADIQKYFLEQVQQNNQQSDIEDEDYDNIINIDTKIAELQSESENLSARIGAIIDAKENGKILPDDVWTELCNITSGLTNQDNWSFKFETLPEFDWKNSKLLPKIVFSHHGRKFRILHSFALFTPEEYLKSDDSRKNNVATKKIDVSNQRWIFKEAFMQGIHNIDGVGIKDFPDKTAFANNKIPTFVGHEGTKHKTGDYVDLKPQSSLVFCIDESGFAQGGYTYVLDDDNTLYCYVVRKGQNMKEIVGEDNETYQTRQVGDLVQDERQKMAMYWTEKKLQSDISSYIDAGGDGTLTAGAIMELKNRSMELKNRSAKKLNAENYLKKCQRWLVFSEKDR